MSRWRRWFEFRFLNAWGDDGGQGTRTFGDRLARMVDDMTTGQPEVCGFCEVRPTQEPALTKAMSRRGYVLAGFAENNALYLLAGAHGRINSSRFRLPAFAQGSGRPEGVLRTITPLHGRKAALAVTHLDYRQGAHYDKVRERQVGAVTRSTRRVAAWRGILQRHRCFIALDENHPTKVQATFRRRGWRAAVKAPIDAIYTGPARRVLASRTIETASDHPIVAATFGRKTK